MLFSVSLDKGVTMVTIPLANRLEEMEDKAFAQLSLECESLPCFVIPS